MIVEPTQKSSGPVIPSKDENPTIVATARTESRQAMNDDLYGGAGIGHSLPKNRFPVLEADPRRVYGLVHDELMLDGVSRLNLATFCTTWVEPEARALMEESLDKNIVDKDEYPQTAELETRCVDMLAQLWHAPNAPGVAHAVGTSTTGSSEAAMLGGLAAKFRWRARRRAA